MGRTFQNVLHSVCESRSFTLMRSLPLGRRCGRLGESAQINQNAAPAVSRRDRAEAFGRR